MSPVNGAGPGASVIPRLADAVVHLGAVLLLASGLLAPTGTTGLNTVPGETGCPQACAADTATSPDGAYPGPPDSAIPDGPSAALPGEPAAETTPVAAGAIDIPVPGASETSVPAAAAGTSAPSAPAPAAGVAPPAVTDVQDPAVPAGTPVTTPPVAVRDAGPTTETDPITAAPVTAGPSTTSGGSAGTTSGAVPGPGGVDRTAAQLHGWGTPTHVEEFDKGLADWNLYDGPGHAGNGRRSPAAATVAGGVLTISGDSNGTTEGMAWNFGAKYGRWEARVKAPAGDPTYNALLLLWPDAENFPAGGEVDFMEMMDRTRQKTNAFVHYRAADNQIGGQVDVDATQWHNWAVEWTPTKITTFVDGQEWWSTTDTSTFPPGPMHMTIQLDWFPQNGGGTVEPSRMDVDWVRFYPVTG